MGVPTRRNMATKLPANLRRNRYGVLYFRIGVPKDLRHHFDTAEIYKSLNTASVRQAASDAQALSATFKHIFLTIRQRQMSDGNDEAKGPEQPKLLEIMRLAKQRLRYQAKIDQLTDELDASILQQHRLMAQHRRELALVFKAKGASANESVVGDGRNLSAYIQPYIESIRSRRNPPSEQTIKSYEVSAKLLVEIIGDKPLHKLSHNDRNRFDETIIKIPKNRQKMPETRSRSIAEIIQIPGLTLMSPSTVKDEGLRANLFLDWVFHHEGRDVPFTLLERFKVAKADVQARRLFSDDELRLVFDPSKLGVDRRAAPYKFWVPLIALHTGARQDEICQLGLLDIKTIDGIECFIITPTLDPDELAMQRTLDKHVKSDSGKRIVPFHSKLMELGLPDYVRVLRDSGHEMLFPDLAHAELKYGALVSKWFGRYCDKLGLSDPSLAFHCFRHQVITLMTKSGVQRELRKVICGHAGDGEKHETHDDYIHLEGMFSIVDRKKAIDALDFQRVLDYPALKARAPSLVDLNRALVRNSKGAASE